MKKKYPDPPETQSCNTRLGTLCSFPNEHSPYVTKAILRLKLRPTVTLAVQRNTDMRPRSHSPISSTALKVPTVERGQKSSCFCHHVLKGTRVKSPSGSPRVACTHGLCQRLLKVLPKRRMDVLSKVNGNQYIPSTWNRGEVRGGLARECFRIPI